MQSIHQGNKGTSGVVLGGGDGDGADGDNAANHSLRSCDSEDIQLPLLSCSLALTLSAIYNIQVPQITANTTY